LVVALAFVAQAVYELAAKWEATAVRLVPSLVAACVVPLLLGSVSQARAWLTLIQHMAGHRVPRSSAYALYFDSQLARYTPGKVGLPVVRMAGAERLGLAARTVGSSILLEMLSWLSTGGLVGALLLALFEAEPSGILGLAHTGAVPGVLVACLGLACLVFVDRQRLPRRLIAGLGLSGHGALIPWATPAYQVAFWLLWAAHGYLLVLGLGGASQQALASGAYFILGPVLGFVALVAPAGVGVREAVISLGLAPALGVSSALAAGVVSRVASLTADLCTWGFYRLLGRFRGYH
jgi:hypothetical protein